MIVKVKRDKYKLNGYVIDPTKLKKHKVSRAKICGVYFLFNKEELIYIGQSVDILKRISEHMKDKVFEWYCYEKVRKQNLDAVEKACIQRYQPRLNDVHNSNKPIYKCQVDVELNSAIYTAGKMFININGTILESKIDLLRSKSGRFNLTFTDIKAEFIKQNGSAIIQDCIFAVSFKGKTYLFDPIGSLKFKLRT